MKMMVDTTSGLFSDGKHWYRPVIRDGTTVLEIMSNEEAAEITKRKDDKHEQADN